MDKLYNPQETEDSIYKYWMDNNCFTPQEKDGQKPFVIVLPPPNITGQLHIGHAFNAALQDIIIRRKRMQGIPALLLPGTDHAAIATEAKVVQQINSEGHTKETIGREGFLKKSWEWKEKYGNQIIQQFKKLGASCDWTRLRFTLDEGCNRAVNESFVRYYNDGLIYRGKRMINWCPNCRSALSDAEVEYEEHNGNLYYIKYFVEGSDNEYIEIATTRPETMLGDTAVAVNPKDKRYKNLLGKNVILPLADRPIPVIADDHIEIEFGTGVLKVTPAHSMDDYEIGLRHGLQVIDSFTETAHIAEQFAQFAGQDRYTARKNIVKALKDAGNLTKIQPHIHNVGTCQRCHTDVEPRLSEQWFVKMKPLAAPAIKAAKDGQLKIIPQRFEKVYFDWLENIRDWCISRQLWWGHRIPVWYCGDCGKMTVAAETPAVCQHCKSAKIRQDEDVLDTWFSSALWPFSTLGWPDDTKDFKYFYPTDMCVTGYDIIFFWVIRMVFSGLYLTGKLPFHTVLFNGLVRDEQGRKFSKSLGNGIDPLEMTEKYGSDALRFALTSNTTLSGDLKFSEEKVIAARNFNTKIWNACRFVLGKLPPDFKPSQAIPIAAKAEDRWVLSRYNALVKDVNDNLDSCDHGAAARRIYDFFWNDYCDWYLEISKFRDDADHVLMFVLEGMLRLMHPFVPFITETIWRQAGNEFLINAEYPQYNPDLDFTEESRSFDKVIAAVTAVRNLRASMDVKPSVKTTVFIETNDNAPFKNCRYIFDRVTNEVAYAAPPSQIKVAAAVTDDARISIPMSELVDKEKEFLRLNKEKDKTAAEILFLTNKLANPAFKEKAPAALVASETEKLAGAQNRLVMIQQSLSDLE